MGRKQNVKQAQQKVQKDAYRRKARACQFCKDEAGWIDYKDVDLLQRFMSDRGKIRTRRVTGNCTQHQREIAVAIKTSRELALLPYTQRSSAEKGTNRFGRSDRSRGEGRRDDGGSEDSYESGSENPDEAIVNPEAIDEFSEEVKA